MGDTVPCAVDGNADLYGLGIRIGVYLQLFATVILRIRTRKEQLKYRGDVGNSFTLSLFIVLVYLVHKKAVYGAEVELIMWILMPQMSLLTEVMEGGLYSRNPWGAFPMFVIEATCCYFAWFFFVGLDTLPKSPCGKEYAFFFSRVNLRGWYRTLQKVIWIIFSAILGISILCLRSTGIGLCNALGCCTRIVDRADDLADDFEDKQEDVEGRVDGNFNFLGRTTFIALVITAAELTIRWNHLKGINTVGSTGQILPFVLGLGLFVHACWKVLGLGSSSSAEATRLEELHQGRFSSSDDDNDYDAQSFRAEDEEVVGNNEGGGVPLSRI